MTPLRITAHMRGPITDGRPPMIDGLLAYVVAQSIGLVAGFGTLEHVDIPIEREPGGRFHLASGPSASWIMRERRYVHRRFPIQEAQMLAESSFRRIHINAGPQKSYRIPTDVAFANDNRVDWWAIGDAVEIRSLLAHVTHLGRRRAVGRGAIDRWSVDPCEPWVGGFPVVRNGKPTRPLPADWPGLDDPHTGYSTLSYPYYQHTEERVCALPDA